MPALIVGIAIASPAYAADDGQNESTASLAAGAPAQDGTQDQAGTGQLKQIVVTAQKRVERENDIGMSIQAVGSEELTRLGIKDTADLSKVTPGLNFTPSAYGTPIFTIRGVGFQDTSLAASPTVSVYVDEVPLPFSVMTAGASLDLQRVEVLKGPQGILFGQNATGGAINYIANKPTDTFSAGADVSYGRFDQLDAQVFVSGPLSDSLKYRVAVRRQSMDDWQHGFTGPMSSGQQDLWTGRVMLQFEPTNTFRATLNVNGWRDRSDTQVPQFFGVVPLNPLNGVDPRILAYPLAPHDPRAADRSACINNSPFNEPFNTIPPPYGFTPDRPTTASNCTSLARDNSFYQIALRMELDLSDSVTLTSVSAYEHFKRDQPVEGDGLIYQDYESQQRGYIDTLYQELRLSGSFSTTGNWIVGVNYERDKTYDNFLQSYGNSGAVPTLGILLGPTNPQNRQKTQTYAVFGNVQVPLTDTLSVYAGGRYTKVNKDYQGCAHDSGDGTWSLASQAIQNLLAFVNGYITQAEYLAGQGPGVDAGPGACATTGPGPTFNPATPDFFNTLDQDNFSFRAGVDWKPIPDTLIYANISRGFKAGGFPTVATSSYTQLEPAVQEQLTAYELGVKSTLFDRHMQLNAALFYYDYKDKQILGSLTDPVFGALPALVNVPKSEVKGFEVSTQIAPFAGFNMSAGVSYAKSRVIGDYYNYDPFNPMPVNFKDEPFPNAPPWQAYGDAQYTFALTDSLDAFFGGTINYQSSTRQFFYDQGPNPVQPADLLEIPARTLVDLRAGIEKGPWTLQFWGRNVFNKWYWTQATHTNDALLRFTGMPATYGMTFSWKM
ncbi:TonB-dependent receptor [Novosphingobium sp. ZN18A2]|uniref:TonB-dependent receptor n=1 Tax=Novosphingobium sp. ZN18A2 TaxID=3079861 RepID=UPI0030D281E8